MMKQNWKRTLQGTLLGAVLLAMAGCGSTNVMDTYSFGHQVIRAGQSEITIALPYEMGKSTKNMSDKEKKELKRLLSMAIENIKEEI